MKDQYQAFAAASQLPQFCSRVKSIVKYTWRHENTPIKEAHEVLKSTLK